MAENLNENEEANAADNNNQINNNQNNPIQNISYDMVNPSSLLNIAKDFVHQKKYNRALTYITLFLKCYPNSFEGFFLKCQIYTKLYRGNKALVLLNKVLLLLDKENDFDHLMEIKILNNRGKCLIFLNRYEETIIELLQDNFRDVAIDGSQNLQERSKVHPTICPLSSKSTNKNFYRYVTIFFFLGGNQLEFY